MRLTGRQNDWLTGAVFCMPAEQKLTEFISEQTMQYRLAALRHKPAQPGSTTWQFKWQLRPSAIEERPRTSPSVTRLNAHSTIHL
jgi:hypothetical protein